MKDLDVSRVAGTSLAVVSLALSVVPCSAQQPSPAAAPLGQPASVTRQRENGDKVLTRLASEQHEPAAATGSKDKPGTDGAVC